MDYHQDRFDDCSLLIFKDKKVIALLPAHKVEYVIHSHKGLTYGGLITTQDIKLKDFVSCFQTVMLFYKNNGFKTLHLKLLPSIYSIIPNDEIRYLMFVLNANLTRRDTLSVLHLSNKLKISKDRLAGNKRAEKYGLKVKEVHDFKEFWNEILIPNLNTKHNVKPVHTLEEIRLLKEKFPKQIRQFNVYKNDNIVAGTTIFETKQVAHSQYISGNEEKNEIGSLDFLHLHLINNVFKDKSFFDFGISNENNGRQINEGLNYWKEGFGARTITQDFYEIDLDHIEKLDTIFV
ncbi:MAG: GNAT family N-acetyltransferase [Flavobacteriaceae bacterium]